MTKTETQHVELEEAPIWCIQPGGGWIVRLELAWGRLRRWCLRRFWPGYVRRMPSLRQGDCPNCPHDVIDSRDLKYYANVCGYSFLPKDDAFRWRDRLPIARPGWAEVVVVGGGLVLLAIAAGLLWPWLSLPPLLLAGFVVAFFRDPPRRIPTDPGLIVSPADGRITDIEHIGWHEELVSPAVKIGIYLSIVNVHVERSPVDGIVSDVRYYPGQFLDVRHKDAPRVNEHLMLRLTMPSGQSLLVRPIAGAFARRIVCTVRVGQHLERGAKTGMIKFGSRTEVFLPVSDGMEVVVRPGDRVRGGVTVLAHTIS